MYSIKDIISDMRTSFNEHAHSNVEHAKDIMKKLESMEERMEQKIIESIKTNSINIEKDQRDASRKIEDLEKRISTLEKLKWYVLGIVFSFGYLTSNLHFFKRFFE